MNAHGYPGMGAGEKMKYLVVCVLTLVANLSYAVMPDQWVSGLKVTEVRTGYKSGAVVFKVDQILPNPANCPTTYAAKPSTILIAIEPDKADVASMLSFLLTAQMAGVDIKLAVSGSACGSAIDADTKGRRVVVQLAR